MALSRIAQRGAVIFPVQIETSPVTKPADRTSPSLIPVRMSLLDGDFRPTATIPHDGTVQDGIWEMIGNPIPVKHSNVVQRLTRGYFLHHMPDALFADEVEKGKRS